MNEITLYLDKTTEAGFHKWLMNEYNDIMPTFKQKPTIDFSNTFEFESGVLKVRMYYSGAENSPPVMDVLKAIKQDFIVLDAPQLDAPTVPKYKDFSFRLNKATIHDFYKSVQTAIVAEKISHRLEHKVVFYIERETALFCIGLSFTRFPSLGTTKILSFEFSSIGDGLRVNVHYPSLEPYRLMEEGKHKDAQVNNHYQNLELYRPYFIDLFTEIAKDWQDAKQELNNAVAELTGQPQDAAPKAETISAAQVEILQRDADAIKIRFGTDKNLSLADVKKIVKRCNAFVRDGGKKTEFFREQNGGKYTLETLRKWLKDPRFAE